MRNLIFLLLLSGCATHKSWVSGTRTEPYVGLTVMSTDSEEKTLLQSRPQIERYCESQEKPYFNLVSINTVYGGSENNAGITAYGDIWSYVNHIYYIQYEIKCTNESEERERIGS